MSIKIKIPNTDPQEYVLIEELSGPGNRTRKISRIITEQSLLNEKQGLESKLTSIQNEIQKLDGTIALKSINSIVEK